MTRPRVLVVEPRELVAASITEYLRTTDVVSLDVGRLRHGLSDWPSLPECAAIVADERSARRLLETVVGPKIVVLVEHRDVDRITDLVASGAAAVCSTHEGLDALAAALSAVTNGGMWLPPDLVGPVLEALMHWRVRADEARSVLAQLTGREREVLGLLAQGWGRAEIARQLSLSPHTVRTHVHHLLRKLSLHSQLAAGAVGRRLLEEGALDRSYVDHWQPELMRESHGEP